MKHAWERLARVGAHATVHIALGLGLAGCTAVSGEVDRGQVVQETAASIPFDARPARCGVASGDIVDLAKWKLTLPSGDEVDNKALAAGFTMRDVFHVDPASCGMVFRSGNRAGHTKGSKYSRSELREMRTPSGSAKAAENNWTTHDGGTMKARLRVDAVSTTGEEKKVGRVVIGQIHGPDTEVMRLYFHKRPQEAKGRLYVGTDRVESGDGAFSDDIVSNADGGGIALGETFAYRIELRGLQLRVVVSPATGPSAVFRQRIDPAYAGLDLYFKAGVYNQNDTGEATDFAQATFFALDVAHP